MSEEAAAPKSKGKMPIVMILAVVLGAGGFFGMKMRGGGETKKPEVKLSKEKAVELKEFLVNLKDHGVYCRTEIALGVAEGVDAKGMEDKTSQIRDAINLRLVSKSLAQVQSLDGLKLLKREIAADLNKILTDPKEEPKADDKSADDKSSDDSKKDDSKKDDAKKEAKAKPDSPDAEPPIPKHDGWDSDKGPVLKVYFNSFATQ